MKNQTEIPFRVRGRVGRTVGQWTVKNLLKDMGAFGIRDMKKGGAPWKPN